jgi:type IV secretory pathway TrbD component
MEKLGFNIDSLSSKEQEEIFGGDKQHGIVAGLTCALVGATMLACAATPVGWAICAVGIAATLKVGNDE